MKFPEEMTFEEMSFPEQTLCQRVQNALDILNFFTVSLLLLFVCVCVGFCQVKCHGWNMAVEGMGLIAVCIMWCDG